MKKRSEDLIDRIVKSSEEEPLTLMVVALVLIAIAAVCLGLTMALWEVFGFMSFLALFPLAVVWLLLDDFWTRIKRKRQK